MLKRLIRIKDYSNKKTTALKLNHIFNQGKERQDLKAQSLFLHNELPIRLAKRAVQLERLPSEITNLNSLQKIHEMYINSFEKIITHPLPNNVESIESFANLIKKIKKTHSNVELDISNAIIDYRFNNPSQYNEKCELIDNVLNNFYLSRISIRFLIGQHLDTFIDNDKNRYVGSIDKKCDPSGITKNVIHKIKNTFLMSDIDQIDFKIHGENINFMYIPDHLEYILFETLKNSVKAIIDDDFKNPNIEISIKKGIEDIEIKISDSGIGFNRELNDYVFSYLYTSTKLDNINHNLLNSNPILSGFAHGLGLSRLYAKYFDGDLKIISSRGIGTDTYIHLKLLDKNEILIF